jgi:hypothetical protein
LKRFIDDIAVEVIEAKLINALPGIFSPVTISEMKDDVVTGIAGESEENRAHREQLNKQLEVLKKGRDTCKKFIGMRLFGKIFPAVALLSSLSYFPADAEDGTIQSETIPKETAVVDAIQPEKVPSVTAGLDVDDSDVASLRSEAPDEYSD